MTDLLIRDLTDAEIRRLDARARAMGISRSEYVRRQLRRETPRRPLSRADLERFAEAYADLADPAIMSGAWR